MTLFWRVILIQLLLLITILPIFSIATTSFIDVTDLHQVKVQQVRDYLFITPEQSPQIKSSKIHLLSAEQWQKKVGIDGGLEVMKGKNWFSIELTNNAVVPRLVYFTFKNRFQLIDVQLYVQDKGNSIKPITLTLNSGSLKAGLITLALLSNNVIYLRVDSDADLKLPIKIISEENFYRYSSAAQYNNGFAIGGMMLLALVMLLLFCASGLKSILLLFGYFLSRALLLSVILGGNLLYLLPEFTELRVIDLPLLVAISSVFMVLFTVELFNLKKKFHILYQRINYLSLLLVCSIFVSLFLGVNANFIMSLFIQGFVSIVLIFIGLTLIKQAQPLASLFTLTVSVQAVFFIASVVTLQLNGLAYIDNQPAYFGFFFWLNAFLIVFMLSRQYYFQLHDKQNIQQQALESALVAKQANEELLVLQQDNQEELEVYVQERTLELNIALQELESSNRELELKNTQDDLSGLYNRRFYDKKILAEYRRSKRNLTPLSLVLIDIDHFKMVNDTHGHLAGDQCLVWLGKKIKDNLKRSTDLGCRYGGEEFCLILPDTDAEGAYVLAEALRTTINNNPCMYNDLAINLTISCGISTYLQQDNILPEQIFAGADKALYKAKNNGRNQVEQHDFAET